MHMMCAVWGEDFSVNYEPFGAFNSTTALISEDAEMAWELINLGEPTNIKIQDAPKNITLAYFYVSYSNNPKRIEMLLKNNKLENMNERNNR